jgi:trans-aconitate methyltransferase
MLGLSVMSQLDFHIEQKVAQRDSIDLAARRLGSQPGWVVEFGLGRGRSYSHLASRFPDREIYCFDREHATNPGWGPPAERVVLGDLATVLADPAVQARFHGRVILAHLDLAWADSADTRLHRMVVDRTRDWLLPGAWILSDRAVPLDPAWGVVPLPASDEVGYAHRFHRYERRPVA